MRELEILRFIGRNGAPIAEVVRVFTKWEEVASKTVERALKSLEKRGLILRHEERVSLNAKLLLPNLPFTTEEKHYLLDSFTVGKALSPRRSELAALEAKLRPFLVEPVESKGLVHVHGRTPVQDIRQAYFVRQLEVAAREKRTLRLLYRRKDEPAQEVDVQPLGIVYYWALDNWYLAAVDRVAAGTIKTYAVERMLGIDILDDHFEPPLDFDLRTWYGQAWGVFRGPLTPVKIRFYDYYATWQRVQTELANRASCRFTQDDQGLLMEDDVVGLEELAVWLRTFGSAAEVLEPPTLREMVKAEWTAALALYEEDSI